MQRILYYFPDLSDFQIAQLAKMKNLYADWNTKINVISRKDIDLLYERHVLHSLGIAKVLSFLPGASVLDVGTGGGFPGIPLAILFPETNFCLIDSIAKKIKVVQAVSDALQLHNVVARQQRAGTFATTFDFVVSRAVTAMPIFMDWVRNHITKQQKHPLPNGILYLKGGALQAELAPFPAAKQYPLSAYFSESFFESKKVVHVPV